MKKILFLIIAFVLIASGYFKDGGYAGNMPESSPTGNKEEMPYKVGEKLVFELTWLGINAGWATLEVNERTEYAGKDVFRIISTAKSNKFISVFHAVDDRSETFMDIIHKYPHRFILNQREGSYKSDKETIFDQESAKVVFIKDGKKKEFDVSPGVQDALSSLYYLRTLELKVGSTININIFDNGKHYQAEVQVLNRERIETAVGLFDTICVKPRLLTQGIFQKTGDVYIWLTDDSRKMPVMMKSAVKIGRITAKLISFN